MRNVSKRAVAKALAQSSLWVILASSASAYYNYVHFTGRSAPYTPIPEKFDLSSLTNKTLSYFVSDQSPSLNPGDTYLAVVSEIRNAAKAWNDVSTSDLRLAYGGLYTSGTVQTSPGINIDFSDDIPPGLLAISGPEVRAATAGAPAHPSSPLCDPKCL